MHIRQGGGGVGTVQDGLQIVRGILYFFREQLGGFGNSPPK